MKTRTTEARRSIAAAGMIAALALTGCSAVNYQATTHQYSASDGVMTEVDDVQFRHIMFVAEDEGQPARMLGMVNNGGAESATVEFTAGGDTVDIQLDPGEAADLEHDEELIVDSIGAAPGSMQEVTVSVEGDTDEATFEATILDGALDEYRDLLPDGFDTSMADHLEHGPDTWGGGAAHYDEDDE